MDALAQLETCIQQLYQKRIHPLAHQLALELPATQEAGTGLPTVLFLGNHSSGKSSFINYLVRTPLQKTGLAPTDDGFTIITYGAKADEFDGLATTSHPDLKFKFLQRLGPSFVSKLRLKQFPDDLLQSITLTDSPGMIDSATSANTRGYDFPASVRAFAEIADLILFFFDPDKPGTTGEAISIFAETLSGFEYKLLIILNKVDLFSNLRDLTRTYGTLCWNLSKTIKTKDIPHIFTTYVPVPESSRPPADAPLIPLHDFDLSRDEVIAEIKRAPSRRADNLVTDLDKNARKLSMHARVLFRASAQFKARRWICILVAIGFLALGALGSWVAFQAQSRTGVWIISLSAVALAGVTVSIAIIYLRRYRESIRSFDALDRLFETAFHRELSLDPRADLRALWQSVRKQTLDALKVLGPSKATPFGSRKRLRQLESLVADEIPKLRRQAAAYRAAP